jgi:hypothetical protein
MLENHSKFPASCVHTLSLSPRNFTQIPEYNLKIGHHNSLSQLFLFTMHKFGVNKVKCNRVLHLINIVTYVRFPWLNDVSTATTMDGRFLSYATILADNNGNRRFNTTM